MRCTLKWIRKFSVEFFISGNLTINRRISEFFFNFPYLLSGSIDGQWASPAWPDGGRAGKARRALQARELGFWPMHNTVGRFLGWTSPKGTHNLLGQAGPTATPWSREGSEVEGLSWRGWRQWRW